MTEVEFNSSSTANINSVPVHYNYGLGSFGPNINRELALHLKTTEWLDKGETSAFPRLLHHRVISRKVSQSNDLEKEVEKHYEWWEKTVSIRELFKNRVYAKHELVLVLEYFPYNLAEWLKKHPETSLEMLVKAKKVLANLEAKKVLHLDSHLGNYITDGERVALTDFGLVLDKDYDLTKEELLFMQENKNYSYGLLLLRLYNTVKQEKTLQKFFHENNQLITLFETHFEQAIKVKSTKFDHLKWNELYEKSTYKLI